MADQPDLRLGDPKLDEDHEKLHTLVVGLLASVPATRVAALDALREHASTHFALEDQDLRIIKDGNSKCHLDEHAAVLKSLGEVRDVLTSDEHPEEAKQNVVQSLSLELLRWLPEHVGQMDAAVATYRSKQRFDGAVPVKITRRT